MVRGTKPIKNLGIVLVFLVCLFVECQGQDVSGLSHIKNKHQTKHPSASATANYISKNVGRGAAALNEGKPRDFSPSNIAMSSQGLQDDLKKAIIKKYLRGQRAQDIIVPSSISQSQPISPSPTPSHNLSNEISQSSYSRRRLNPIYCDSVNNGVCITNKNITIGSDGIFTPFSLLFNGASIGISAKSLVIQSTVECTSPLCKMTFQDFDLLQIAGSGGSLIGSDIRIDVTSFTGRQSQRYGARLFRRTRSRCRFQFFLVYFWCKSWWQGWLLESTRQHSKGFIWLRNSANRLWK